ncbi:MAG: IS200/IS605 family transposase [Nanoarchaeota archaeon]
MEIEHACHCTYRIRYHMVFVVKYRKHMLLQKVPLERFRNILTGIGERYYLKFDAIGVDEDHFHIVVGAAPRYSPSHVMQIIKSITAKKIFEDYPEVKDFLWGGNFWTAGGHIDSVSEFGGLEKIKKYVREQGRSEEQVSLLSFD